MSQQSTITTNADKVYEEFRMLATKEMRRALRSAINAAASKLRNSTKRVFRQQLPAAKNHNPKYNDTLLDAVIRSKLEETKQGEISAKVHIMGSNRAGSGTYRARFFEVGTKGRTTRKGYNRGAVKALHYFKAANDQFQADYNRTLNDQLDKAVQRINNKKIK